MLEAHRGVRTASRDHHMLVKASDHRAAFSSLQDYVASWSVMPFLLVDSVVICLEYISYMFVTFFFFTLHRGKNRSMLLFPTYRARSRSRARYMEALARRFLAPEVGGICGKTLF